MTADLKAIRARLAAATPGPWHAFASTIATEAGRCTRSPHYGAHENGCGLMEIGQMVETDANLVANAPAWLAELCDEVERLQAGREVEREMIRNAVSLLTEWEAADRRVRALHTVADCGDATCEHCRCSKCGEPWPCSTSRALDGAQ